MGISKGKVNALQRLVKAGHQEAPQPWEGGRLPKSDGSDGAQTLLADAWFFKLYNSLAEPYAKEERAGWTFDIQG